jgi:hypothetical protein
MKDTTRKPPGLIWLLPIIFFGGSALTGEGGVAHTAPLWARVCAWTGHLLITTLLVCLWLPRRRKWRRNGTTSPMPPGTSQLVWGWLFAAIAGGTYYDQSPDASPDSGAVWAAAAISALLFAIAFKRLVAARR